jgi:hypothetical protein
MGVQSSSLVPVTSVREVKKEIDGFTVKISVNGKDINDGQDLDYIQQVICCISNVYVYLISVLIFSL